MPNLRLVYDNAADRATSLTASSTQAGMSVTNMLNNTKSLAHRSLGTSVTYTTTWIGGETVGCVALPATNLTGDATIRVRLYSDEGGLTLISDSLVQNASPGLDFDLWNWSQPLNVNSFAYGGFAKSVIWFENQVFARRCQIDLVDLDNPAGYIDSSRLVIGSFWSPKYNIEKGLDVETVDTSESTRTDGGDLVSDRGTVYERLKFNYSLLTEADRVQLMQILQLVGTTKNILVSALPGTTASVIEQDFLIYGKRNNSSVRYELYNLYKHSMEITGW